MISGCRAFWVLGLASIAIAAGCHKPPPHIDLSNAYIDARTTLAQSAEAKNPFTRANAIEAMDKTLGPEAGEYYKQALSDSSPVVQFVGALAVGDIKYAPAHPVLLQMVQSGKVRNETLPGVLYALHQLGDDTYTGQLAGLLFSDNQYARANAALVMGRMNESSAVNPLRTLMSDEQSELVRLQVQESLARLGDSRSAELLEPATKNMALDIQIPAIQAMSEIRPPNTVRTLRSLLSPSQHPCVRVAAAGGLGRMGIVEDKTYEYVLEAAQNPEKVMGEAYKGHGKPKPREVGMLRELAVVSLGWMGHRDAIRVLQPLLKQDDGPIRVAAAESILRLVGPMKAPAKAAPPKPAPVDTPEDAPPHRTLKSAGGKD